MVSKTYESLTQAPQPDRAATHRAEGEATAPVAASTGQMTQMQQRETAASPATAPLSEEQTATADASPALMSDSSALNARAPMEPQPQIAAPLPTTDTGPLNARVPVGQHQFPTPFPTTPDPFRTY